MITREQVADLRAGDVVEVTDNYLCTIRGPLREGLSGGLVLGNHTAVRYSDGGVSKPTWSLTVVSRATRLYVNHDRTEPVAGDVVAADGQCDRRVWFLNSLGWQSLGGMTARRSELPTRLRLLVDGETGQVVA